MYRAVNLRLDLVPITTSFRFAYLPYRMSYVWPVATPATPARAANFPHTSQGLRSHLGTAGVLHPPYYTHSNYQYPPQNQHRYIPIPQSPPHSSHELIAPPVLLFSSNDDILEPISAPIENSGSLPKNNTRLSREQRLTLVMGFMKDTGGFDSLGQFLEELLDPRIKFKNVSLNQKLSAFLSGRGQPGRRPAAIVDAIYTHPKSRKNGNPQLADKLLRALPPQAFLPPSRIYELDGQPKYIHTYYTFFLNHALHRINKSILPSFAISDT